MQTISAETAAALRSGSISLVYLMEVLHSGAVVRTLDILDGTVHQDATVRVRRRLDCTLTDPDGDLTPVTARDLLTPYGTELRPSIGVRREQTVTASDVDDDQAQWAAGTRSGTSADPAGDLVLGNV